MQYPILSILLHLVMGSFALAAAYGIVAPLVDKTPFAKIKTLVAIWIAVLLLMPLPSAYLASFMEDKKVSYLYELSRDWWLWIMLLGGVSVSLFRRWRKKVV